jgi:ribosomal protein S18 acetylase RimI-like enzyme
MVELAPMSPPDWEAWRVAAVAAYARQMAQRGVWPAETSLARASALFAELVPDGQESPGHVFRHITLADGSKTGALWLAAEDAPGRGTVFLWDIVIDEAHRGRGLGRAALAAAEALARWLGYERMRLHVFGDNEVARGLYRSAGYEETDVTMEKRIGSPAVRPPDAPLEG